MVVDVYQTDDNLVVETALPGVSPDDVDISVIGNTLTIKGQTECEEERKRRASTTAVSAAAVPLPVKVEADKAEAAFENAVLKLTLPKAESDKPKKITVKAR